MHVATVVGQLWATAKNPTLEGLSLLLVRPFVRAADGSDAGSAETMVAVDTLGADLGERVLVVHGRAARFAIGRGHDVGFQTAIVGIVDSMELDSGTLEGEAQRPETEEEDKPAAP